MIQGRLILPKVKEVKFSSGKMCKGWGKKRLAQQCIWVRETGILIHFGMVGGGALPACDPGANGNEGLLELRTWK